MAKNLIHQADRCVKFLSRIETWMNVAFGQYQSFVICKIIGITSDEIWLRICKKSLGATINPLVSPQYRPDDCLKASSCVEVALRCGRLQALDMGESCGWNWGLAEQG